MKKKREKTGNPVFGKNMQNRRNALGWKPADLAQKSGFSVGTIKNIECAAFEGDLPTREAIAGALGCTLADLYLPLGELAKPNTMDPFQEAKAFPELMLKAVEIWQDLIKKFEDQQKLNSKLDAQIQILKNDNNRTKFRPFPEGTVFTGSADEPPKKKLLKEAEELFEKSQSKRSTSKGPGTKRK